MPRKTHHPPPATLGPGRQALTKRQRAEGIAKWAELLGTKGKRPNSPTTLPIIDVKAEPSGPTRPNRPSAGLDQLFQGNELPEKTNPKAKPGKTHRRGKGKAPRAAKRTPVSIDTRATLTARGRSEPAPAPIQPGVSPANAGASQPAAPPPGVTSPVTTAARPPPIEELTPKQQRFVEEFLIDLNGAGAARRAGYSKSGAKEEAYRLLTNAHIQDAIATAREALSVRTQITLDDITRELAKIGFANLADYFNLTQEGGDPFIDLTGCTRDQLAALQQITVEDYVEGRGDDARLVKRVGIKMGDKKGSLGLLSDLLGHSPKKQFNLSGSVKVEGNVDALAVAIRRMETKDLVAYDALARQQEALLAKSRPPADA
jgi:phage terminase small subunit